MKLITALFIFTILCGTEYRKINLSTNTPDKKLNYVLYTKEMLNELILRKND